MLNDLGDVHEMVVDDDDDSSPATALIDLMLRSMVVANVIQSNRWRKLDRVIINLISSTERNDQIRSSD